MTADIRTAAQREVESVYPLPDELDTTARTLRHVAWQHYVRGFLAGAARVTPTREQIRERMQAHHFEDCVFDGGQFSNSWIAKCSCGWESPEFVYPADAHDAYYVHASEQVAELMQELAEGESVNERIGA